MWTGAKVIDPIAITKIYSVSNYDVLVGMDYDYANQASGPSDTFGKVAKQFEGPGFQKLVIVDNDGKGTTTVFNDYKFISEEFNTIKVFLDQDVEFVPGSGAKIITIGGIQFGTFAIDPTAENVLIVTPTNDNGTDFVEGVFKFDLAAGLLRNPETLKLNPALTYTVNFIDEIPTP
jgi:hypothetical protein